jgi:hypothetical protein
MRRAIPRWYDEILCRGLVISMILPKLQIIDEQDQGLA